MAHRAWTSRLGACRSKAFVFELQAWRLEFKCDCVWAAIPKAWSFKFGAPSFELQVWSLLIDCVLSSKLGAWRLVFELLNQSLEVQAWGNRLGAWEGWGVCFSSKLRAWSSKVRMFETQAHRFGAPSLEHRAWSSSLGAQGVELTTWSLFCVCVREGGDGGIQA